ncbi:MAG: pseudaminic acid synthase [Micavibrio sp.]
MIKFSYPDHPFIIAEMSGNHNQSLDRALEMIEIAANAGADAVKLQTYTADTITINHDGPEFLVDLPLWKGRKLYDLYQEAHTPWDWHKPMFDKARDLGITIFSSPFDETAVDLLEGLGAPLYKIASFELVDLPLIKYVAQTHKPMIMSTGMATLEEIRDAVEVAQSGGCPDITLLHCVSAYPAPVEQTNLATMVALKKYFPDIRIGLSDHSMGTDVPVTAVALGAQVIEKHFTIARADGGVDSAFSLEPYELKELCEVTKGVTEETPLLEKAIGVIDFEKEKESSGRAYRPSLYVVRDVKKGEIFSCDNVRSVRPANGLPPKELDNILGKKAVRDLKFGEPLQKDMIL